VITTIYTIVSFISALFNIISLLLWAGYIVIVSIIVKYLYTDKYPTKAKPITSAVIGTAIGATINFALGLGQSMFAITGIILAVIGTIVYIRAYNRRHDETSNQEKGQETQVHRPAGSKEGKQADTGH